METIYLDTHVIIWLFSGDIEKISQKAVELIEENELLVSPMVVLELEFLYEIKRLKYTSIEIISYLSESIDLRVCNLPFNIVISESIKQKWTRDPFDRIIVANAICNNSILLTKDIKIRKNYKKAIW